MDYADKLREWNSTDKYRKELDFLYGLIHPKEGQKILDYGCGIMTAMQYLANRSFSFFYGYDVTKYADEDLEHLYDNELKRTYNTVYLNHSIAHITDPLTALIELKKSIEMDGKLVIITPNWEWMDKGYNNDPTVIKHYTIETLSTLVNKAGYKIENIGQFGEIRKDIHQHNRLSNERIFLVATT